MLVTLVTPDTTTGTDELVVVPSPNSPWRLYPQHLIVPPANSAHEWFAPVLMLVAPVTPDTTTGTGTGELVVVPSPNCP